MGIPDVVDARPAPQSHDHSAIACYTKSRPDDRVGFPRQRFNLADGKAPAEVAPVLLVPSLGSNPDRVSVLTLSKNEIGFALATRITEGPVPKDPILESPPLDSNFTALPLEMGV
jgi:hypothetical protein